MEASRAETVISGLSVLISGSGAIHAGHLLPLAALCEDREGSKDGHVDMMGELVSFCLEDNDLTFTTRKVAAVRHFVEKHRVRTSVDKLQVVYGLSKGWKDVKGDLFRFEGGAFTVSCAAVATAHEMLTSLPQARPPPRLVRSHFNPDPSAACSKLILLTLSS